VQLAGHDVAPEVVREGDALLAIWVSFSRRAAISLFSSS
jgi:hypothetical protein